MFFFFFLFFAKVLKGFDMFLEVLFNAISTHQ